ncbi:MAG: hypothetical protein DSY79_08505, partial [Chloroflexi bacterium]
MYEWLLSGTGLDPASALDAVFEADHQDPVVLSNITFYSLCEHHLLPFFGTARVAYVMSRVDLSTFTMPADGSQIMVGDGPELLVYRQDGQPIYKDFCDNVLVGMVCTPEYLVTVDASNLVL